MAIYLHVQIGRKLPGKHTKTVRWPSDSAESLGSGDRKERLSASKTAARRALPTLSLIPVQTVLSRRTCIVPLSSSDFPGSVYPCLLA